MPADRGLWLEALEGVLAFSDDLKARTQPLFLAGEPEIVDRVSFQMGLRGRRVLQAVRALAQHEWDDVIGNLSRSLVETAIELDYIHKLSDPLGAEVKAGLYECYAVIAKKEFGEMLDERLEEMHAKAVAFREKHGVKGRTWHGRKVTGEASILEELTNRADPGSIGERRARNLLSAFRLASHFEHNNALQKFYFERIPNDGIRLLDGRGHDGLVRSAVLAGTEILWTWATVLGVGEAEREEGLKEVERVQRIDHDLGPDAPPPK